MIFLHSLRPLPALAKFGTELVAVAALDYIDDAFADAGEEFVGVSEGKESALAEREASLRDGRTRCHQSRRRVRCTWDGG